MNTEKLRELLRRIRPNSEAAPWVCEELAAIIAEAEKPPTELESAIAAGDGTLHGAIDYWQARALAAEAKKRGAGGPPPRAKNFRGETYAEIRQQLINVLIAHKSWMAGYAEAYVDTFADMIQPPSAGGEK